MHRSWNVHNACQNAFKMSSAEWRPLCVKSVGKHIFYSFCSVRAAKQLCNSMFTTTINGITIGASSGPFYLYSWTSIPAWISNHTRIKCGKKCLIHSQISTVQLLKFGNRYVISSHTLWWMQLFIHADIKVNPCYLKVPQLDESYLHKANRIYFTRRLNWYLYKHQMIQIVAYDSIIDVKWFKCYIPTNSSQSGYWCMMTAGLGQIKLPFIRHGYAKTISIAPVFFTSLIHQ